MIKLTNALKTWGTADFETALQKEIQKLNAGQLPLQAGLSHSSYVSDSKFSVLILKVSETTNDIIVRSGICYAGFIAGSCCVDDPTPMSELTEYCEVQFAINKLTGESTVVLLDS